MPFSFILNTLLMSNVRIKNNVSEIIFYIKHAACRVIGPDCYEMKKKTLYPSLKNFIYNLNNCI